MGGGLLKHKRRYILNVKEKSWVLFMLARTWKQPKCPLTGEWILQVWYIYIMEYYSDIKKNEIGSSVVMWMELGSVIQSEVS